MNTYKIICSNYLCQLKDKQTLIICAVKLFQFWCPGCGILATKINDRENENVSRVNNSAITITQGCVSDELNREDVKWIMRTQIIGVASSNMDLIFSDIKTLVKSIKPNYFPILSKVSTTPRSPSLSQIKVDLEPVKTLFRNGKKVVLFVPMFGDFFPEREQVLNTYRNCCDGLCIHIIGFQVSPGGYKLKVVDQNDLEQKIKDL